MEDRRLDEQRLPPTAYYRTLRDLDLDSSSYDLLSSPAYPVARCKSIPSRIVVT